MGKLELKEHSNLWKSAYDKESVLLKKVFEGELLFIHHIGSTSIKGMLAKPIVDILIEVQDINKTILYEKAMENSGYVCKGENGIKGRRYYVKNKNNVRSYHVHVYQIGSIEATKHLAFRDYLIENEDAAKRYQNLKENIFKSSSGNLKLYQDLKSPLVQELTKNAIQWANKNKKISVIGYILRNRDSFDNELLTLRFNSLPNIALRIPGGGVEINEDLIDALNREIKEETGLDNLIFKRKLGTYSYYKPFSKKIVERHDYLLFSSQHTSANWNHIITGDGGDSKSCVELKWIKHKDFMKVDPEHRKFLTRKHIPELFDNDFNINKT